MHQSPIHHGTSNDQVATKRGKARKQLAELAPAFAHVAALEVHHHRDQNGNMIREFYVLTARDGHVVLLNPFLRELGGFGVNRKRGTIRSTEQWDTLIELISTRVHGHPNAYEASTFYPTLPTL